ncbi:glycosyltransferase family 4 protein [Caballeronia telluris]|uniref:Glycosyl transferase, group 1 n=1 Tax=Caballeronia telluris TaxID=326475 RepID=A0A158JWK9_9BURK|nr:glycosyltransferase family 4 protein [Caballeronia telluris]SAL73292.1 glycosyl transferase, group 1 [Caballeronia telluris]
MRILHLVLAPRLSGAEVLAKDLAIHQQRGGETVGVTALTPAHDDFGPLCDELTENGVQCLFPARMHGRVGKLWNLYQTVKGYRADVLFAHATIPAFYARTLPLKVPVVYVMHSATNDFESYVFRRVERMLSRRARAVIAVSPTNIDDYVGAVGRHPSMTLIPNGVDMARFGRRPLAGIEDANGGLQIVQVGRYTSVKNQLSTVHAFERVVQTVPEARLLLCGVIEDPAYHAAVGDLVSKLGLASRVTLDGPRSDVADLLQQSRVFAMPSRSEGHSIAFLEALASGVPVVASTIRPFSFAADFPGVHLCDPDDTAAYASALVEALGDPRSLRPLGGLTLADTAARYLAVAQEVTRGMPRTAPA